MKYWRHVKRGTVYREIGDGIFQVAGDSSIADEEPVIIYAGEDGRIWARPKHEFIDGRFEEVEPAHTEPEWTVDQERERCAKIADAEAMAAKDDGEDHRDFTWGDLCDAREAAERIAAAIRKGDS